MSDRTTGRARAALFLAGRTVGAAVVLGAVAGVVVLADLVPAEAGGARVAPAEVAVPPTPAVLVCPGPLRLAAETAGDAAYDPAFDPTPRDATNDLVALGVPDADGTPVRLGPGVTRLDGTVLAEPAGAAVGLTDLADASVVRVDPSGEASPWAAAATAWRAGTGDLRGLAAASCQRPAAETWLVGGSTRLGSSARLVLQNAGATPATVTVRMWGAGGPLELAGAPDYLVPPGTERVILLEGLAAEQSQLVAHVSASGGLVSAFVQDSRTSGLVPAGVDLVVGGAAPATVQAVPAVSVVEDAPEPPVVRVLAPDEEAGPAHVEVAMLGPDGVVRLPGTADLDLDPGEVVDVPLDGLPPGDYTAWVRSDVPVVAGAMVTRAGTAAERQLAGETLVERAWSPAVARTPQGALALPGDEAGRLVVTTVPGAGTVTPAAVTLEVLDAAGGVLARHDLAVPAGSSRALDLAALATPSGDADDDAAGGDDTAADGADGDRPGTGRRPAAVVLRTDDPRVVWGAVLDTGTTVGVLAPVPPAGARPAVAVTVR